jgi:enoyl-CoA hydratase/carnithine racemase
VGGLVDVGQHGSVCVITLDRPEKLNALSTSLEQELKAALGSPEATAARAVVVAGAGRAFSAGADVSEFLERDPASILAYYRTTGDVYEQLAALPCPTIAAIHGYCLGGGLELALACDFRVAEDTASFGFPEIGLGILPSSGGTYRLVRAIGPARAKELILLRTRFDAAVARDYGLVTELTAEGAALLRALELGEELAALPPAAVRAAKRAIALMPDAPHDSAILIEQLAYAMLAQTEEHGEAARAFVDKRS